MSATGPSLPNSSASHSDDPYSINKSLENTHIMSSPPPEVEQQYIAYPIRWLVLFTFAVGNITNAVIWINFAPIQDISATYFSTSSSAINGLSVVYMAIYLPGSILASYMFNTHGLRKGLLLASFIQAIGAWIRYIGCDNDSHARHGGLAIVFIGQTLAGLAQPFYTNSPAKLAGDWFSLSQRNLATTIAAMTNPIGIAVGQLLPSMIVNEHSGMPLLLLIISCIASAVFVFTWLFIREHPPTPPSHSAAEKMARKLQRQQVREAVAAQQASNQYQYPASPPLNSTTSNHPSQPHTPLALDQQTGNNMRTSLLPAPQLPILDDHGEIIIHHSTVWEEVKTLLRDRNFLFLMCGVGVGLGMFNTLSTLIEQLVKPSGYTKDDAGIFGALIIGAGLVGAGIVGPIMDKTHAYNKLLKIGLSAAFCSIVFLFLVLRPGQFPLVCVGWALSGFCMLPLLPVCMECAAECTYPISEDASSGCMLLAGNVLSIILIFTEDYLIGLHSTYTTVFTPAAISFVAFLFVGGLLVLLGYHGPYKRQAAEKAGKMAVLAEDSENTVTEQSLDDSTSYPYNFNNQHYREIYVPEDEIHRDAREASHVLHLHGFVRDEI